MTLTMNKFKVEFDEVQQSAVIRIMGCCRFVRNHFLVLNRELCNEGRKTLTCEEMRVQLDEMMHKEEYAWIQEAESSSLNEILKDLNNSVENYSEGKAEYPELASKKASCQSYRILNENNDILVDSSSIILPKIGKVELKQHVSFEGKIQHATIFRTSSNHYFICLAVETQDN